MILGLRKKGKPTNKRDKARKERFGEPTPVPAAPVRPAKIGMAEKRLAKRRAKNKVAKESRRINYGKQR